MVHDDNIVRSNEQNDREIIQKNMQISHQFYSDTAILKNQVNMFSMAAVFFNINDEVLSFFVFLFLPL